MSEDLPIQEGLTIPGWELWFSTSRSSGAGGQHVNRTESRVTVHWHLSASSALTPLQKDRLLRRLSHRLDKDGVLQLHAEDHRSQLRNKEAVLERLRALIIDALKPRKPRIATRPTRGSIERRIRAKKEVGEKKSLRKKPKPPAD